MSQPDQRHRCQALNAHGSQCRNTGEPTAIHPARLCRQHQHAARNDCLRLTAEGQETVDYWRRIQEENERLTARMYYVAIERTLADGTRIINAAISPYYVTPEQAREAREALFASYPDARVIKSESYCRSAAERDAILAKVIQPEEATA